MQVPSAVQPKRPKGGEWQQIPPPKIMQYDGFPVTVWLHTQSGIYVISTVEVVRPEPGEPEIGPEYHLSMSCYGRARVRRQDAKWVLKQFGLEDAKEDNHVPHGIVRNFWRPVADNLSGYECPCIDEEPAMREDRGDYVWRGVTR